MSPAPTHAKEVPLTMTQQLHALLALIDQIVSLTELEEQRLESERAGSLNELIREKTRLAGELQQRLKLVRGSTQQLRDSDAALREQVLQRLSDLQQRIIENGRSILRRKKVSEGLLSAIASEQQRAQMPSPVYNGRALVTPNAVKPPAASIAVNAVV